MGNHGTQPGVCVTDLCSIPIQTHFFLGGGQNLAYVTGEMITSNTKKVSDGFKVWENIFGETILGTSLVEEREREKERPAFTQSPLVAPTSLTQPKWRKNSTSTNKAY